MRRLVVVLCALAVPALAQEIGTEIPPPLLGPRAVEERPSGVTASAGTFGFRASLGASTAPSLTSGSAGLSTLQLSVAPSAGAAWFATEQLKLLLDVGVSYLSSNGLGTWQVAGNVGVEYLFRTSADALRPLLHVSAAVGAISLNLGVGSSASTVITFEPEVGGGAEYFVSPSFAVHGRLGLAIPLFFSSGSIQLVYLSLKPTLGATFYF